jgi:hypothetical protein
MSGGKLGRPGSLPTSTGTSGDRPEATPTYQRREREHKEVTVRPGPARLSRDKVLELLKDGSFHSAHEISNLPGLTSSEWYVCLGQLLEFGYTFRRRGNSIAMNLERRPVSSKIDYSQELSNLLAGIDATKPDFARPPNLSPPSSSEHLSEPPEPYSDSEVDLGDTGFANSPNDAASSPQSRDALMVTDDPQCFLPARSMVTATRAILARKSSGKTYLGMIIAEEFLRLTADTGTPFPFVVIDPTGVWYGLCATVAGQPSSHKILRLGGEYGDWTLDPNQGSVTAELVVSLWPQPIVLDISDMLPEEQHQFAADFGAKFYTINHKPIHVFVDEADDYMPQSVETGNKVQRRCLGVWDRVVRRGRVKGIGVTLITQRPAVISKNVLSQVDGIYVLSVSAPHDLEAIDSWMRPSISSQDRDLCLKALPTLQRGEVFLVQANLKAGALVKFATRAKTTFDSSRTPTVDDPEPTPAVLSKVDEETWDKAGKFLGHEKVASVPKVEVVEIEEGDLLPRREATETEEDIFAHENIEHDDAGTGGDDEAP